MSSPISSASPLKSRSPLAISRRSPSPQVNQDEFVAGGRDWTPPKSAALLAAVCSLAGCAATPMTAPVQAQVQLQTAPKAPVQTVSAQLLEDLEGKQYQQYLEDNLELPRTPSQTEEVEVEACPVRLCSRVLRYNQHIEDAAERYQVDANLIRGVIAQESQGFPNAGSPKGARGLMQLMPDTARQLGVHNRSNPRQNVMGGTRYLAELLQENDGNVEKALWAYNAGPGNLAKGIKPAETRHYIPAVQEYARQFESLFKNDPT